MDTRLVTVIVSLPVVSTKHEIKDWVPSGFEPGTLILLNLRPKVQGARSKAPLSSALERAELRGQPDTAAAARSRSF